MPQESDSQTGELSANRYKGSENFSLGPPQDLPRHRGGDKANFSSLSHREKELVSNHRHKALRVHRRVLTIIEEDRHNVLTVRHILQVHCPLLGDALTYLASAYL